MLKEGAILELVSTSTALMRVFVKHTYFNTEGINSCMNTGVDIFVCLDDIDAYIYTCIHTVCNLVYDMHTVDTKLSIYK